jgi:hypothetical protein
MSTIIISSIVWDNVLPDGRRSIRERIVTDDGHEWLFDLTAPSSFDVAADLVLRETVVLDQIAQEANMVPQVVTSVQFRLALDQLGLLDIVNSAVANADRATQIRWQFGRDIARDDPYLINIAEALNKSNDDIDVLFRLAGTK